MADIVIKNEKGATATMINPTTGKRVAVVAGGDYAKSLFGNGFYLEGKGGVAVGYTPPTPNSTINSNQQADFNTANGEPSSKYDAPITDLFAGISGLTAPTPYSATDTYKNLIGDKTDTNPTGLGIAALETQLGDITNQERQLQADARARRHANEGQTVALGAIAGRQSEIDRQTQDQLESFALQKAPIVAALQTKYQTVNTMMSLMQTDYQNATEQYNSKFTHATQLIETMRGLRSDQMTAEEQARSHASANLAVITSAIKDGSANWASLDAATKANITKLETESGLPIGFTARLHSTNPNADIMGTTTRTDPSGNSYADVMMRDKNGKITVQHVLLGRTKVTSSGGGSSSAATTVNAGGGSVKKDAAGGLSFSDKKGNPITAAQYASNTKKNLVAILKQSGNPDDKDVINQIQGVIDAVKKGKINANTKKKTTVSDAYADAQQEFGLIFDGVSEAQFKQMLGL